jgi:hypothetical protein
MSVIGYVIKKNQMYGQLTALHDGRATWPILCRCECGTEKKIRGSNLRSGNVKSCGCLRLKQLEIVRPLTHGLHLHPLYSVWRNAKSRCYNPNDKGFKWYGARGIKMQESWKHDAESFITYCSTLLDYENRKKFGLSLDRINTNGDYAEGNLQWSTALDQTLNRRKHS